MATWIIKKDKSGHTYGECSACGGRQYAGEARFCMYCGEKMDREDEKLKPCPFCGGEAFIYGVFGMFAIGCKDYGCRGCVYDGKKYNYKVQAMTAWNRRASE